MTRFLCFAFFAVSGFAVNAPVENIVRRSDIILQRPNRKPSEAMPLGNGRLGVAIWAANGLTIQLNRSDTLPGRLSPGQIVVPGLAAMADAADYSAKLNLYDGEFSAKGGGATVTVYLQPDVDAVVIEATGADLSTASIHYWKPRQPDSFKNNKLEAWWETWVDSVQAGASGKTFGTLAAMSIQHQRIIVAAPHWAGGDALKTARSTLAAAEKAPASAHREWWHQFWNKTAMMQLSSTDGSAEYFENLRNIYLFASAASSGGPLPGSQAGTADLFSPLGDFHKWDPGAYWHYNLRMLVAANLGAGLFEQNRPYFNLYLSNLGNIQAWTNKHMRGMPGICVPETMRFNGQGFENEEWIKTPGLNCDADSIPYYNARTLSTGAEVSLWIWQQYLATDDKAFWTSNLPIVTESAKFLLAYSKLEADGKRHTSPTNAHENQWDVKDSTNDICAMRTLSQILAGADVSPAIAAAEIPDLPVLNNAIGISYVPKAEIHNTENVGLEPVWPYGLIGDSGPLHEMAVNTFKTRPNVMENDWSFDPLQAARLGLSDDVKSTLMGLTKKYQEYPAGFAHFIDSEFYIEQIGVVAATLQEALVQDYDGVIRVTPAWPKDWDVSGTVCVQHRSKVHVEVRKGAVISATLEAGFTGTVQYRKPDGQIQKLAVQKGMTYPLGDSSTMNSSLINSNTTVELLRDSSGPRFLEGRTIGLAK